MSMSDAAERKDGSGRMLKYYIYKITHTPPGVLFAQISNRAKNGIRYQFLFIRDRIWPTTRIFKESGEAMTPLPFRLEELDFSGFDREEAKELWRMYREHRFDLLGSGWLKNDFTNSAPGFSGYRYDSIALMTDREGAFLKKVMSHKDVKRAMTLWRQIGDGYEAIDWQKDCKSGYRWGAKTWYRPQAAAKKPGGDIKAPWELGRLQHLPRLAILAEVLPESRDEIIREILNELLDFIAQNPVRMGVNYMCTMDVGIRTANVALSISLVKKQGIHLEKRLETAVCNFVFEHCDHIRKNLEWTNSYTSNHYFANIAGLLYGASVLPECNKKRDWMAFARREVEREIKKQFHPEGTNREGSTAYHRLTGEMALNCAALLHALSEKGQCEDLDDESYHILYGACRFALDITKPDGTFSQIGDNDSGLFFRLSITGGVYRTEDMVKKYGNLGNDSGKRRESYLDENMNDAGPFLSSGGGMFEDMNLIKAQASYPLEASLIRSFMQKKKEIPDFNRPVNPIRFDYKILPHQKKNSIYFPNTIDLSEISHMFYPAFGLYLYRAGPLYLCIAMTDNGQNGNAGHAHNDKLSFELSIGGRNLQEDSGTFVYTASPEERNRFRSVKMHNTIDAEVEQNDFISLFSMKDETRCHVVDWGRREFTGMAEYKGVIHCRRFLLREDRLEVYDYCNKEFEVNFTRRPVTYGYGKIGRE